MPRTTHPENLRPHVVFEWIPVVRDYGYRRVGGVRRDPARWGKPTYRRTSWGFRSTRPHWTGNGKPCRPRRPDPDTRKARAIHRAARRTIRDRRMDLHTALVG